MPQESAAAKAAATKTRGVQALCGGRLRGHTKLGHVRFPRAERGAKIVQRASARDQKRRFLHTLSGWTVVAPGRLERPTNGLGNRCSIHLSYGANSPAENGAR